MQAKEVELWILGLETNNLYHEFIIVLHKKLLLIFI